MVVVQHFLNVQHMLASVQLGMITKFYFVLSAQVQTEKSIVSCS